MAAELRDDGTMDTVVACPICGEEQRYNWDGEGETYDEFVEWALEDFDSEHECPEDGDDDEPGEDDITTEDHRTFYQHGKIVMEPYDRKSEDPSIWVAFVGTARKQTIIHAQTFEEALRKLSELEHFWPNVFFISDHGNAHRIDL